MSEPAAPPPAEATFQRRRINGTVHLQHDRGAVWMAWFFGAIIVVIVASLFLGRLARSEAVRGYVSAASGLTRLDAQAAGIVREIAVKQGDTVKRGARLMQIQLREQTTGGVSTVGATLRSLQERRTSLAAEEARLLVYLDSTRGDRAETERNVTAVLRALDEQERTLKEGLAQQEEMVSRVEAYLRQGYATRETLNGQRRAALDYARQIAELRARRAELRQSTSERLRAQRGDTEKAAQLATTRNELSAIEAQITALGAQSRIDVVAPTDGEVAGLYVQPGDSVTADQVVAILGDTRADPLVVLEVPARAIGLAKVGQEVVLKYDAFPFKTFGIAKGAIAVISGTPLRNPMLASADDGTGDAAAAAARQSVYRVEVRPESRTMRAYGTDEPIRIGSTLSADIVVERRRLIDWMLDPIRAMRGRG
jgi:membrane fusion protein